MYTECTVADEMLYATLTEEQKRAARCVLRDEIEDDNGGYDYDCTRIDRVREWLNGDDVLDAGKFAKWLEEQKLSEQYPDFAIVCQQLKFTEGEIEEKLA